MRYVIFSDMHSNLEALEAFIQCIEDIRHDRKVCLGDIIGYGADPNLVTDWVRAHADIAIAGNHDWAVIGKTDRSLMNPYAFNACLWTKNCLSEANEAFIRSLPLSRKTGEIFWVHASPQNPEEWNYIDSLKEGRVSFEYFDSPLCFVGHSHRPKIFEFNAKGKTSLIQDQDYTLKPDCRYIVNVGSLGQPRDGDPDPSFVVYDSKTRQVKIRRFQYRVEGAQKKILKNGLPPFLAERLGQGY